MFDHYKNKIKHNLSINKYYISKLQQDIALSRDESAYRKLFLLFHQSMIRFATSIVLSEEVAEEIYSDTMLKIWLMEDKLSNIQDLRQYLFKVTKNSALNHLTKAAKNRFIDLDSIDMLSFSSPSPEEKMLNNEFQRKISEAVNALPPKCQLVYRLIKEEEFNYRQTAEILDLSLNTVERHMNSAMKKVVGHLKPYIISSK